MTLLLPEEPSEPDNESHPLLSSLNKRGDSLELIESKDEKSDSDDSLSSSLSSILISNHYSLWIAVCFALNYSIGSGILGLPLEFYSSGYLLGSVLLIYMGALTYFTYMYFVDGLMRAEAISILATRQGITRDELLSDPKNTIEILTGTTTADELQSLFGLKNIEFQLSEIIGMFCGKYWKWAYDITYGLDSMIGLWSYSTLFGVSLARNVGISSISDSCNMSVTDECRNLYSFYVFIFWIWTVFITLMDFTEQQWLQVCATCARMLDVSLMVITSIALIYSNLVYDGDYYVETSDDPPLYGDGITAWTWSGIPYMVAVAAFAFGNQYCVSDIVRPMKQSERHKQHSLWATNIIVCTIVYILCGIIISVYFGNETESPCTLAWKNFIGFFYVSDRPLWSEFIGWFIVLFPVIDIATAYPLNAATFSNTYEVLIFSQERLQSSSKYRIFLRVCICTLSAILALIEWNFSIILALSGGLGLLATYGGPCVMEYYGRKMCVEITGDVNSYRTVHTNKLISNNVVIIVCLCTCVIAFIGICYDLIAG